MFAAGLSEEVEALRAKGYSPQSPACALSVTGSSS